VSRSRKPTPGQAALLRELAPGGSRLVASHMGLGARVWSAGKAPAILGPKVHEGTWWATLKAGWIVAGESSWRSTAYTITPAGRAALAAVDATTEGP
jgi:hypothetical protein